MSTTSHLRKRIEEYEQELQKLYLEVRDEHSSPLKSVRGRIRICENEIESKKEEIDLLSEAGLGDVDTGRFRGIFMKNYKYVLHTRNGSGNDDLCEIENRTLRSLPNYIKDKTERYDTTYRNFYFYFPEEE
jgi:hypothetical protein